MTSESDDDAHWVEQKNLRAYALQTALVEEIVRNSGRAQVPAAALPGVP